MTRKQALNLALQALDDGETKNKIQEILNEMPFTHWSEKTIFDTVDQFIIDHNRVPCAKDFKKQNRMPPHPVIKLRFKMTVTEFLKKYYPCDKIYYSPYSYKNKNEWKTFFISEFIQNKPTSEEEYNQTRKNQTPTWDTIARMFGIKKWNQWLSFCELKTSENKKIKIIISNEINILKSPKK